MDPNPFWKMIMMMNKLSCWCFPLLLLLTSSEAFTFPKQRSTPTVLPASPDRIKQVGGGIPLYPAGDRHLFDPELEGKLQGTDNLNQRLAKGFEYSYLAATSELPATKPAQHFLEAIGLPQNFAKPSQPTTARILGRGKLIADDAPGDIQHVVMELPSGFHYVEGQSLSVIPPGVDAKGKPHKPRLYSIASTRYGDLLDGKTVSLCIRRAEYTDPATGRVDPAKRGVCSNFLCDTQPGDLITVAGPIGKTMLLPEDPNTDIIMVATGTGIAPFRAFLHRLFMENTVAHHLYNGNAWLILGVPVTGGLLYHDELEYMKQQSPQQLQVTYAISREMTNAQGGKLYVQDVLAERAEELFTKLDNGAVIYFCGLKGMMPGILDALERVATEKGIDWSARLQKLKANHQWHVEVY